MKKICNKCKEPRELSEFYKEKRTKDGLDAECKECLKNRGRTKDGLLNHIYNTQRVSSKKRGHPFPTYSKEAFIEAILDMPLYHTLHAAWVASGYEKDLVPSIDRLEDDKPYTEDNIQLMTWQENRSKYYKAKYEGNSTLCRPVTQLSLDGTTIKKFKSMSIAARSLKLHQGYISAVCRGKHKTCGGYKFEYTRVVA